MNTYSDYLEGVKMVFLIVCLACLLIGILFCWFTGLFEPMPEYEPDESIESELHGSVTPSTEHCNFRETEWR